MSPSKQDIFDKVAELTELYLVDEITADQIVELESLVRDDEQAAQAMRAVLKQAGTMRVVFKEQRQFVHRIGEADQDEYLKLLQALSPSEELDPVNLVGQIDPIDSPSKEDWAMAGRYLFEHYITPKRIAITAAAAAVLLAASLLVFFLADGSGVPVDPVAINPPETKPLPQLPPVQIVASITDQLNARWRYGDLPVELSVGTTLSPQQRLTLTHGFAEITTERGATALLQAPATIELTNSDNAIRLHQGKLVGHCQTAESQGFTVHVPDMDVVDLGTTFGVEADVEHGSTVLVMEGEVRAQPISRSPKAFEPVVLKQAQARRVAPETGSLETVAVSETPVFYSETPHPYVAAVLDAQPVAYWRFEDDAGKTIANEVDSRRDHLKMVGPATLTNQGVIGNAGRLVNQGTPFGYFETSGAIDSASTHDVFTIELWYYTDRSYTITSGVANLMSVFDADSKTGHFTIQLENDERIPGKGSPIGWKPNSIRFTPGLLDEAAVPLELYTKAEYAVQQWQHLVMVNHGESTRVYLDGRLVEDASLAMKSFSQTMVRLGVSSGDLQHGLSSKTDLGIMRPLRGRLDEVALYDKTLTAEQVAKHYELATNGVASP